MEKAKLFISSMADGDLRRAADQFIDYKEVATFSLDYIRAAVEWALGLDLDTL